MTPQELTTAMDTAGMTREELAAKLGITTRQVRRYLNGDTPINRKTAMAITLALPSLAPKVRSKVSPKPDRKTA
jgi:transcriptional regulator with XRE-family HTH domain